ncbi:MAG: hypothetical protein Q7U96_05205 [Chloroflexota bacterium]|nr:hypothetical protein [Chloroflexota bacterium]
MKEVGLWIDHRRAVIVTLDGKDDKGAHGTIEEVVSGMEKHVRYSSGAHVQEDVAEDQQDKRFNGHLNKYYEEVAGRLRDAAAILILGPGEAKGELQKLLTHQGKGELVVGVQAADKMTDNQLAVLVRQHFRK